MLPQVAWRRTQSANHNAVPDDHCIAELFAPSSARGMAGAEAGKRNIPGTACLRLVRAHVIIADEAPTALTEPVLGKCYTRVSQGVAPCLPGLTADGLERRSGMATTARGYVDTLSLFRLCLSVLTIGCVRSTACQPAPTCCAPIRNVGPVGEPSQRQGDMSSCGSSAGPSQRKLSFARFVLHAANSTASGLCDDGIHKPSACAGNELWGCCTFGVVLLGGTGSARQPCARICALPYPLIDCDTYPSPHPSHRGLSHVCGE